MPEKQKFITQNLALNGEPQIIKFIANFVYFDDQDVHNRFKNGYCYYFAKMLSTAFPGGYIAWAVPFGHLVYMYNQVPYDIEGVYPGEATEFIPEIFLGDAINDFKHNGHDFNANQAQLDKIIDHYHTEQRPLEFIKPYQLSNKLIAFKLAYDLLDTDEQFTGQNVIIANNDQSNYYYSKHHDFNIIGQLLMDFVLPLNLTDTIFNTDTISMPDWTPGVPFTINVYNDIIHTVPINELKAIQNTISSFENQFFKPRN